MILRINFEQRIVILRIFSRRFLHEQKKSYLLLILSPIIAVSRNRVLPFYLRNKGETIRIRIRFRFRFIETSCLLPLQIKVSAGKLLFRLARNHLPFHYFPCPLHSAPFHASLSRIFLFYMSTAIAFLSPLPHKDTMAFSPEVVAKVVVTSPLSVKFCFVTNM